MSLNLLARFVIFVLLILSSKNSDSRSLISPVVTPFFRSSRARLFTYSLFSLINSTADGEKSPVLVLGMFTVRLFLLKDLNALE